MDRTSRVAMAMESAATPAAARSGVKERGGCDRATVLKHACGGTRDAKRRATVEVNILLVVQFVKRG